MPSFLSRATRLTPDPAGFGASDITSPQSLNQYAYVLNSPVAGNDPSGLDGEDDEDIWFGIDGATDWGWSYDSTGNFDWNFNWYAYDWQSSIMGQIYAQGLNSYFNNADGTVTALAFLEMGGFATGGAGFGVAGSVTVANLYWAGTGTYMMYGAPIVLGAGCAELCQGMNFGALAADEELPVGFKGLVDTSKIGFSQKTASDIFGIARNEAGEVAEGPRLPVQALVDQLRSGGVAPGDVPPIRVLYQNGQLFTLDNRRLLAAHLARVPVNVEVVSEAEFGAMLQRRMSTVSNGQFIHLTGDGNYGVIMKP